MMKISCCILLVLLITPAINTRCIHDEVQASSPVTVNVDYDDKVTVGRSKRDLQHYQPIRIKFFKIDFDFDLTLQEWTRLNKALEDAVQFIEDTFSVIPVNNTLILKRTGCLRRWLEEPHAGKCADLRKDYKEEYCHDLVKIPASHLDGLWVWRKNNETEDGEEVFSVGEGIDDTDTVLYITAKTTATCYQRNHDTVLTYSGYCQLDQHSRPVAGFMNFCPYLVRSTSFSQENIYMSIVHELFHTLGFSKDLFAKFRDCSKAVGGECPLLKSQAVRSVYGAYRLVTSAVIQKAQRHFDCHREERFGGPLHVQNGMVTSHWSPKLMSGSIMTPDLGPAHQTVIDPLTLAFFEDTGWYKVDYSRTGVFLWGKDAGCKFGSPDSCRRDTAFFCTDSKRKLCHYLHKDKGQCHAVDRDCGIVRSDPQDQCVLPGDDTKGLEVFSDTSMCFMSNLTLTEGSTSDLEGKCLLHRCEANQTLEVKVQSSDWIVCPYGSVISVPGYHGSVKCPALRDVACPLVEECTDITTQEESTSMATVTTGMWSTAVPSSPVTKLRTSQISPAAGSVTLWNAYYWRTFLLVVPFVLNFIFL